MTAGHVSIRKIYSRDGLAPGSSETTSGKVTITKVEHSYTRDNYNQDSWKSWITVKNTGDDVTGYDVWQSWVDLE